MTIEEAIKTLNNIHDTHRIDYVVTDLDAIRLGIEALKKVKAVREGKEWVGINPLPGESEE